MPEPAHIDLIARQKIEEAEEALEIAVVRLLEQHERNPTYRVIPVLQQLRSARFIIREVLEGTQ